MLPYLTHLMERTGQWSYLVIFLGALLESAAFLGLIIPGESLVLLAGFLAAQGLLDLDVLIAVVAVGAVRGDRVGCEVGRWMGRAGGNTVGGRKAAPAGMNWMSITRIPGSGSCGGSSSSFTRTKSTVACRNAAARAWSSSRSAR